MSSITAQQIKLDLELVPKEKRLEIGKYNGRLNPGKKQREPTFQVMLDALALTPCNFAFLMTTDVPEVYMHQFWDSIHKYENSYRVHGQNFDELPTDEDIVSFFKELGHTGQIKTITDIVFDQMHQPWRTFTTTINRSLSGKTTGLDKLRLSRAHILWGMYYKKNVDYVELLWEDFTYQIDNRGHKKQDKMKNLKFCGAQLPKSMTSPEMRETKAYKTDIGYATGLHLKNPKGSQRELRDLPRSDAPTSGVVIRETPVKSLSKKKEKMTVEKRKGIDLLSEVALTKEAQYEEVRKKSLRDFHKTHCEDEKNSADDEDETNVDDKIEGDEDEGMDYTTNIIEDAHVTLSIVPQKTKVLVTRSSHSFDLASKFLNFSDISHTDAENVSPMDVMSIMRIIKQVKIQLPQILPKEVSNFAPPVIKNIVTKSLDHAVLANESSQPKSTYEAAASLTEFELKKVLIDKMDESQSYLTVAEHRECYDGLIKSYDLDKSLFSTYDKIYSLKRSRKDKDKDEDPSAGSD
ncbi:hypothetical protein Tco_0716121 [Tanacetum coccineum]